MFNRKGMIDVVELHKRGLLKAPKRDPNIDKFKISKDGYVELKKTEELTPPPELSSSTGTASANNSFFDLPGFSNSVPTSDSNSFFSFNETSNSSTSTSSNLDAYEKREVDEKVEKLDNLIFKLEQRIAELEKKLGVNKSEW